MSLVKFNKPRFPWQDFGMTNWLDADSFFMDDFFTRDRNLPAMNVKENKDNFEIELAVPGFSKKDIEVFMENDLLHIAAKKRKEVKDEFEGYTRKEFGYYEFDRKLKLPSTINQDKPFKAIYKDGVLTLHLFKLAVAKVPAKKMIQIA